MSTEKFIPNGQVAAVRLTHMLMPWNNDDEIPVFLALPQAEDIYIPLFASEVELRTTMERINAPFDSIKKIRDATEFLESIPATDPDGHPVKVITDIRLTPEGKIRFTEVLR